MPTKPRIESKGTTTNANQVQKEPIVINIHDSQVSIGIEEPVITNPSSCSTSQNLLEITQSAGPNEREESNVFTNFLEIKQNNEALKANVYAQLWKQTSTSQHRLLTTFNSNKGRMHMAFLQAQVPFPKGSSHYRKTIFSFDANQIHPIHQMDMHRESGEMLFSTMTNTAMALSKLKTTLSNM